MTSWPGAGSVPYGATTFEKRPWSKLEIPALCIGNAVLTWATDAQQIWLAEFTKHGFLTPMNAGWLASGELAMTGAGTLAVALWGWHVSPRLGATVAAGIAAVANIVSTMPSIQSVTLGRLSSGLAVGALIAVLVGAAVRRPNAQRVLALMLAVTLLMSSLFWFIAPALLRGHGTPGIFAAVSGLCVVSATLAALCIHAPSARRPTDHRVPGTEAMTPWLAACGVVFNTAGMTMIWSYSIVIANHLGFNFSMVSQALGVAQPVALVGPIAAHVLGERLGLLRPAVFALAIAAVNFFYVVNAPSVSLFATGLTIVATMGTFYQSYAITLVDRLDSSGRVASATPMFVLIGVSVGPVLGGRLITNFPLVFLAAVAAACIMCGTILFLSAARLGKARAGRGGRNW